MKIIRTEKFEKVRETEKAFLVRIDEESPVRIPKSAILETKKIGGNTYILAKWWKYDPYCPELCWAGTVLPVTKKVSHANMECEKEEEIKKGWEKVGKEEFLSSQEREVIKL